MITSVKVKELEAIIRINQDEAHILNEIILFAMDYDAENHRFTVEEDKLAKQLHRLLDSIENMKLEV